MGKVTKYYSQNLYGETPREEEDRLKRVRRELFKKSIKKNKLPDPSVLKEIRRGGKFFGMGTSKFQKKRRRSLIKKYS